MTISASSPPATIGFTCSDEEVFLALNKLLLNGGSPLPTNVIDFINPYSYEPQHLPDDCWFLISSKDDNNNVEHGFWNIKEDTREVFSNDDIIGWRTTLEYFKGQAPHDHKTNWVMQVFSATQKKQWDIDNEKKETSSLCRVVLVPSHEIQEKVGSSNNSTEVNKPDETVVLPAAERSLAVPEHQGENLDGEFNDSMKDQIGFFSGGDFLELQDLDNPASSSSSENSSVISISSDECFDAMAFLQDLEDPIVEQNDASRRLHVSAPNNPDEIVIEPDTLGYLVSIDGDNPGNDEFLETAGDVSSLASGSGDLNNRVSKHANGVQGDEGGPSSSACAPSTSSGSHQGALGGMKRAGFGGMRKLGKKYLCFIPFLS